MEKFTYEVGSFNFAKEIKDLYGVENLDNLHLEWSEAEEYDVLDDVVTDQLTVYHDKFYKEVSSTNFYPLYDRFLSAVVFPLIEERFLYQAIPTFRIHQPNNIAVAAFHKDSDYSHSVHEINFFVPLTKAEDNNTVWVESEVGKEDYSPMNAELGEFWMWKGAELMHGNKLNDTGKSRVSFDFRILPEREYRPSEAVTVTNKTVMALGGYWKNSSGLVYAH